MSKNISKNLPTILFVDDEEKATDYFGSLFGKEYNILLANNITDALKIIEEKSKEISIIISDQRMPGGSGIKLLEEVKNKYPNIIRMLTTAYTNLDDNIAAINTSRVYAYITKPWNIANIRTTLSDGVAHFKTKLALLSLGGSIAHEVRNPLNVINLSLGEIVNLTNENRNKNLDNDLITKINKIVSISQNAIKRSNNIIDITLDSLKDKEPDPETFIHLSIKDIIAKTLEEYGYSNESEKNKIKLKIKDNFIFKGDETLLIYVLFNLIKNALYYLEEYPDSTITISSKKGKKHNKLYVKDTGAGIPEDKLESIFDSFITSGKKGGTGLGLAFCKRTMNYFQGDISCTSKLGEWTEFLLTFPALDESKITLKKPKESSGNIDEDLTKVLNNKSILLAEDDLTAGKLTTFLLKRLGAEVTGAENGEEVLKELEKNNKFDLIFMDTEMPKMGGIECTGIIQKNDKFNKIPIIALTGNADDSWKKKIHDVGIKYLLAKPLNKDKLLVILNNIF